jgi:signal transduction histidine kinase
MAAHAMLMLLGKLYAHITIECVKKVVAIKKEAEIDTKNRNMFVASASHDLKSPLNSLLGCLDLLKSSSGLTSAEKEKLLTASYSGEIMNFLIANILDASKIDAGKFSIDRIPMNIMEEIEKVVKIERELTKKKGLQLYKKVLTQMPKLVYGDAMRLSQILINLLSNSIKFTSKGYIALIFSWSTTIAKEESLINNEEPLIPCESYFKVKEGCHHSKCMSSAKLDCGRVLEENCSADELEDVNEAISDKLQKYILLPKPKADTLSLRAQLKQYNTFIHKLSTENSNGEIPKESSKITGDSGVLIIEVIDTGIGISGEEQKKLFRPFNQANSSVRSKYGGSGLGLWITKQIVYLMRGFIKLRSQPQKGTRFTISLPLKIVEEKIPKHMVKKKVSSVSLLDKTSEMVVTLKECKRISFTGSNKILNKMNILFINCQRKDTLLEEQIMNQLKNTDCHLTYSTCRTALHVLAENDYEFDALLVAASNNKYELVRLITEIIKCIKKNEYKQIPFCITSGNTNMKQ